MSHLYPASCKLLATCNSIYAYYGVVHNSSKRGYIILLSGYHALSDIVYACSWCGWPRPEAYKARMRCVHEDFVEICRQVQLHLRMRTRSFTYSRSINYFVHVQRRTHSFVHNHSSLVRGPQSVCLYMLLMYPLLYIIEKG